MLATSGKRRVRLAQVRENRHQLHRNDRIRMGRKLDQLYMRRGCKSSDSNWHLTLGTCTGFNASHM